MGQICIQVCVVYFSIYCIYCTQCLIVCLISFSFSLCFIIITAIDSVAWLCCIFMSQGCLSKQTTEQINHFHLTAISSISTAKRKFRYHSNSSTTGICLDFFRVLDHLLMRAKLLKHLREGASVEGGRRADSVSCFQKDQSTR